MKLVAGLAILGVCLLGMGSCRPAKTQPATVEIELWTLALRPFFDDYMRARLEEFEQDNAGVKVNWVDVPFEAMDRKLIAAAGAERTPDVVNFSDKAFARYIALGAIRDIGPLLPAGTEAEYLPAALRLGRIDGRLLALPWYLTTQTVVANQDLLSRGGLTAEEVRPEWSWLLDRAVPFRAATGTYLFSTPLGTESDLPMMMLADGHMPLMPVKGEGRLRANLLDPSIVALVERWVKVVRAGGLPREAVTGGSAHLPEMYQNGRVAIINSGPNFLQRIRDVAPEIYRSTKVRPPVTGALGRAHIAVMVLCVTSQSKHPMVSAALVRHLTSARSQEALCELVPVLASTTSSLDATASPPAGSEEKIAQARATTVLALRDGAAFTPAIPVWPEMRRVFEDRIKRVFLDGADTRATLGEINDAWDRLLDGSPAFSTPEAAEEALPRPGQRGAPSESAESKSPN